MGELGETLRKAREAKRISPVDVRSDIKMQDSVLIALEEGDYGKLPAPPYTRGLVRLYAEYLGLDVAYVLRLLNQEWPSRDHAGVRPMPSLPSRATPWGAILIFLLLASALALFFIQFYVQQKTLPIPITIASQSVGVSPSSEGETKGTLTGAPSSFTEERVGTIIPGLPLSSSPALTPTAAAQPTATLEVRATERAWLRVVVDGSEVFVGILQPGQSKAWTVHNSIIMRTGNAGGTIVIVNGVVQPGLGRSGQVADWSKTL